jgi:hypothetical protein
MLAADTRVTGGLGFEDGAQKLCAVSGGWIAGGPLMGHTERAARRIATAQDRRRAAWCAALANDALDPGPGDETMIVGSQGSEAALRERQMLLMIGADDGGRLFKVMTDCAGRELRPGWPDDQLDCGSPFPGLFPPHLQRAAGAVQAALWGPPAPTVRGILRLVTEFFAAVYAEAGPEGLMSVDIVVGLLRRRDGAIEQRLFGPWAHRRILDAPDAELEAAWGAP